MGKLLLCTALCISLWSCASGHNTSSTAADKAAALSAEIIRTGGGIPHIYAENWQSLGFGTGYVMSEDNICTLARLKLKFSARQAEFLGTQPEHLNSDLFYQLLIDRSTSAVSLDPRLESLFAGAAAGYNHYLQTERNSISDPDCRDADWLLPMTALDLKRVSGADYALDYMLPMIVAAQPPEPSSAESSVQAQPRFQGDIASAVADYMEVPKQGGSNAIAIGAETAQGHSALLMANPHMPWNQPSQRFYPMHQVIPGELNMLGANLIGRPRVGFGTTEHVAWTSTVSTAKRASFYRLELVAGNPTQYRFDGQVFDMRRETVTVGEREHVFFSTHFGAFLVQSPFFLWSHEHAFAVRMPNAGFRGENSAFEQYAATSVRELKAVHDRYQFMTVNLIAADASGEVMYTDPGPVPHLTNAQLADCSVLGGAALDGSRSDCQWTQTDNTAEPGIIPAQSVPLLYRRDYVTNSNDSYWLTNPRQPLEGFPKILGEERSPRTLRTRSGLSMLQREIDSDGGVSAAELNALTLANENFLGQDIRDDLVNACSTEPNLQHACAVLADWDLHDNLDSRGAHLLRQTAAAANGSAHNRRHPPGFEHAVAFDPQLAVSTPSGLSAAGAAVALEHLQAAVTQLQDAGIALDAALGDIQTVRRGELRIPLHGGPESVGVFNKIESDFSGVQGYPDVSRWSSSWIMTTGFGANGPEASGILTYSLSNNPNSPYYSDQTQLFSNKQWLQLPFHRKDVESAATRRYKLITPQPEAVRGLQNQESGPALDPTGQ